MIGLIFHSPNRLLVAAFTFLVGFAPLHGADAKKGPRVVVGKYVGATGLLLARDSDTRKWAVVKRGDPIYSGDTLVGKPGASIDSKNGAVRLIMLADLRRLSPYPILEPAAVLHTSDKDDLDFTIDRGRMVILNQKKEGAAEVRARFADDFWSMTLKEPGTLVGMELYGRWPRGIYWHKGDNPPEAPTLNLTLIVLKGEIQLRHHKQIHLMRPPPGPAMISWDSVVGDEASPTRLETLPVWADDKQPLDARAKRIQGLLNFLGDLQAAVGVEKSTHEALEIKDLRRMAIITLGATDDLPKLIDLLSEPKYRDMRNDTILILRHWIGRGTGQDQKLYDALLKKKYTPVQAETIMHLLHSFDATALSRPETFETLIAYLKHDKLAIRELAEFHLYRLVPAGQKIAYNPAGTAAEREAAFKEWKNLVPDGQLPPRPKEEKKEPKETEKLKD